MDKKFIAALALSGLASAVSAQGYAGAVLALSKIGVPCEAGAVSCDTGRKASFKLYAGTKLKPQNRIDLGIGAVDALEFSYMRFARRASSGAEFIPDNDVGFPSYTGYYADATRSDLADALTLAAVANFPVIDQVVFSAKLGVAYVSATSRKSQGVAYFDLALPPTDPQRTTGGKTTSTFKPYIGLGLAYEVPNLGRIVGSYDRTQFDTDERKGAASLIGLGVEKSF